MSDLWAFPVWISLDASSMLCWGLQELNGSGLVLPKSRDQWPDQERLEMRYAGFLKAG